MAITIEKQEVNREIQQEELNRLEQVKGVKIEAGKPRTLETGILHIDTLNLKARIKDPKGIVYTWNITKE